MTNEEMSKRIEELESKRFYLSMKDHWTSADFETDRKWWTEILDLEKELGRR